MAEEIRELPARDELFQIGIITATHGLKGEVKVFPTTDDPLRMKKLDTVYLDTKTGLLPLHIKAARPQKDRMIVAFKEFSDINDVEPFKKCPLLVTRENAAPLGEDEYYIAELIGLSVYLEDETFFGEITDVLSTGANDVYVVSHPEEEGHAEVLIPAIKDCIRAVDMNERRMTVRLLPGLYTPKEEKA